VWYQHGHIVKPDDYARPGMPEKRRFPIRLPEDLFDRLAEIAQEEGRSVNNLIQYILRRWLEQRGHKSDADKTEKD
jgi:hypothetical protein